MMDRSNPSHGELDREVTPGDQDDYAAEYRDSVRSMAVQLKHVARFSVNYNGGLQEVSIPPKLLGDRNIGLIVSYINSGDTCFTRSSVGKYRQAFESILEVVLADPQLDWRLIGRILLKSLKAKESSEYTIKTRMDHAKRLITKAGELSDDVKARREIRAIVGGSSAKGLDYGYWPSLREAKNDPRKSLEDILGDDLSYTNAQYVDAIVDYASAYIRAWSNIRSRLRNEHPDLCSKIVATVKRLGLEKVKDLERQKTCSQLVIPHREEWLDLLALNIEILVAIDDPLLNQIALAQYRRLKAFDRFAAEVDLPRNGAAGFAQQLFYQDGSRRVKTQWAIWKDGRHDAHVTTRLMLTITDFLEPSLEEELCFTWLMASRRIQLSNVDRLRRSQIDEDSKNIWIRSYKGRNGKAENLQFSKGSKFGRAIRAFLKSYDEGQLRGDQPDYITSKYSSQWGRFFATYNFYHLAFPRHEEGLGRYGVSDFNLALMKGVYRTIVDNQRIIGRAGNCGDIEKPVSKALNPSAIAQSHVYAEEAKRGDFSKSSTMDPTFLQEDEDELERNALNSFHTRAVREDDYRARSRDKVKLQKGKDFAVAVSSEMVGIANEIANAWEVSTSKLSVSSLIDIIGLRGQTPETPPETLLAAAKAEKFIVEKSGLIKKDGKIYLFDSGLTARLMMEEIRHIEGELEGLFATQDVDKAINAWAKLLFLEILIKRFSARSLKDAVDKYGHLEGKIPHAPISEGGNSWIVK